MEVARRGERIPTRAGSESELRPGPPLARQPISVTPRAPRRSHRRVETRARTRPLILDREDRSWLRLLLRPPVRRGVFRIPEGSRGESLFCSRPLGSPAVLLRKRATVHAPMIVAFGEGVGLGRAGGSDGNEPQSVSS